MEILNESGVTPQRMHAMLKLVALLERPKSKDIYTLLQPSALADNHLHAQHAIEHARKYGLVIEDEETKVLRVPDDVRPHLGDPERYRHFMQRRLTSVADRDSDNYLLNLFTAWYAVQGDAVVRLRATQIAGDFREQMQDRSSEARGFNDTKFNGWRNWASFLGWGHQYSVGSAFPATFVPDASRRLSPMLPKLMPNGSEIGVRAFRDALAAACPELDGGVLFRECWEISHPNETQGNLLSLMLSTGLRVLEGLGVVTLRMEPDAKDVAILAPAEGLTARFSHIRLVPA